MAIAAQVCFYGTEETGAGYLCILEGSRRPFGDAEPVRTRSFTSALWEALERVRLRVPAGSRVQVIAPDAEAVAEVAVTYTGHWTALPWRRCDLPAVAR